MAGDADEDLREFRRAQRRLWRRNAVVSAVIGAVLIPVALLARTLGGERV